MNGLTRFSLRNRALIALVTVFTVLIGLVAMGSLRKELIPSIQVPLVAVITAAPGSGAPVVEQRVTAPIEAAVLGVEGVEGVESTSAANLSTVRVTLTYGIDLPQAQAKLQRAVLAVRNLPEGVEPEVIAGSVDDFPVMQISATGGKDAADLERRVRELVVPELKDLTGVRDVQVTGAGEKVVAIDLDEKAMERADLSAASVAGLLQANGIVVPAGTLTQGRNDLQVEVGTRITSVDDLRKLPLTAAPALPGGASALAGSGGSPDLAALLSGGAGMAVGVPRRPEASSPTPGAPATTPPQQPAEPTPAVTDSPAPPASTTSPVPPPTSAPAPPPGLPTGLPTQLPTGIPTTWPSGLPTALPSGLPTWPSTWPSPQEIARRLAQLEQLQGQLAQLRQLAQLQGQLAQLRQLQGQLAQLQQLQGQLRQLQQLQGQLSQLAQLQGQLKALSALQGPLGQLQQLQGQLGRLDALQKQLANLPGSGSRTVATPKVHLLGDVARVDLVDAPGAGVSRSDGKASLTLTVTKTPAGGAVEVSHAVRDALTSLSSNVPNGSLTVVFDQAPFIEKSIEDLSTEGLLGLGMAVLVVLVFLMSVPLTLVTAVSIPLSLLAALIGLHVGGLSLNILTLGALTIAVGRVVDDSIVVIENIKRHLDLGEDKAHAIPAAVKEVAAAITASTVATVAVFLPIGVVGGQAGELFRPFAITVALAMGASLLVALTIIPVLGYWFIRRRPAAEAPTAGAVDEPGESSPAEPRREHAGHGRTDWLQRAYLPALGAALRFPVVTLVAALVLLGGTGALATRLKTDFIGGSGSTSVVVNQELPAGTTLAVTDKAAKVVESIARGRPDVASHQVTIAGGGGGGFVSLFGGGASNIARHTITLDDDADVEAASAGLRDALDRRDDIGDITVSEASGGPGSSEVEVAVQAADADDLRVAAAAVEKAVAGVSGARDVTNSLGDLAPTLGVRVDRAAALRRGLTEPQIGRAVAAAVDGTTIGRVEIAQERHDVVVREGAVPADAGALRALVVGADLNGKDVPLRDVATVQTSTAQASISRQDGRRTALITAVPTGDDLGGLTRAIQSAIDGATLPAGASATIGGVSADQEEAFGQLGLALLVAVAIVYVVMVATFGSLLQPFLLLVSIPFAATGALAALEITDTALGVPAIIGLLMLVGIVVTNAIVLIDLVNQYRAAGAGIDEAVTEGARDRLRPIVMTALATILALTPMAMSLSGGGAFISQPLALVVIGGLFSSTALTLLLVPVLYVLVERLRARRAGPAGRPGVRRFERRRRRAREADADV